MGSLARIVGPLAAGIAFDFGPSAPYLLGALVAGMAAVLAIPLRPLTRLTDA